MNERIVTEIVIDARQAAQGAKEFEAIMDRASAAVDKAQAKAGTLRLTDNLPRSVDRVSASFDRLRASIDPVTRAQLKAETEMRNALALVDRAVITGVATQQQAGATISALRARQVADIDKVIQAQQRLNHTRVAPAEAASVASTGTAGIGALGTLRGALGPIAGYLGTRQIVDFADAWTEAGNKLRAVSEITGVQTRSLSDLNKMAQDSRSGIDETAALYSRLVLSASKVASSEQQIADATLILNRAFKAGGASASEQASGILQLSQALGSGVLQGDELRSLRENAPLVAKAIADEFKTTIGGLKALGATGELTADRIFKAILASQKDVDRAFNATNATIADGFTRIKNSGEELIGTLSRVTGAGQGAINFLQEFGSELDRTSVAVTNFGQNPGLDNFFAMLGGHIIEGGPLDRVRDLVNKASEDTLRSGAEIRDDIARTQQQIADLQQQAAAGIGVGTHIDDEINNLRLLQDELAGVDRASRAAAANGVGAMASLVNSANAAIDKAVAVNRTIQSMQDKTITITTVYQTSGGPVTVHRPATPFNGGLSTNPVSKIGGMDPSPFSGGGASSAGTIPTAQMINVKDFLSGTRAAGGPVDAGSTYMVGEHGPEIVTMAGAGNVSSASSTANILTGGASVLKSIEENTFQTVEEIKRSVGYLDTMEKDGLTAISLLRAIQTAIGSSASAGSSYSGGSSSSGGGGMGGSTSQPNPFRYVGGVFYPGNGGFNAENYIAWEKAKQSQGFATGGAIHPGDTQKVEAWKRPDEAVAFFRPEQRAAVGDAIKGGTKTVHMTINMPRSGPVTRETKISDMEAADRFRRAVRDELGAL